jgi:hypothetical protein
MSQTISQSSRLRAREGPTICTLRQTPREVRARTRRAGVEICKDRSRIREVISRGLTEPARGAFLAGIAAEFLAGTLLVRAGGEAAVAVVAGRGSHGEDLEREDEEAL